MSDGGYHSTLMFTLGSSNVNQMDTYMPRLAWGGKRKLAHLGSLKRVIKWDLLEPHM
jgi:hypothetical protein